LVITHYYKLVLRLSYLSSLQAKNKIPHMIKASCGAA
jgi:hypothetical protein